MDEWIFANIIVFLASVLQAVTGFGFAIMSTPLLLLVFNSRDCIQMSILLSFFIALILTPKIWREVNWCLLHRLIVGSIVGVPIGLLFFSYMSLETLKKVVSSVILITTLFSLVKGHKIWGQLSGKLKLDRQQCYNQPLMNSTRDYTKSSQRIVGLLAGVLTTSIGMPGVPLAVYFNACNTPKTVIRSTTLVFFIFVYVFSIMTQMATVQIQLGVLVASLQLIPATIVGVVLGYLLFPKINQKVFQQVVNSILVYTALYMFVKAS